MKRTILATLLSSLAGPVAFGQSAEIPKFEAADVRVSVNSASRVTRRAMRTGPAQRGRYEIKSATMVDLIRTAYSFDADKILGGPNWLEWDQFDVVAKVPADITPDMQRRMLQSLLEERFKLAVRKEAKPLPAWALTQGRKLQLKEADGTGQTGCSVPGANGSTPGIPVGAGGVPGPPIATGPHGMLHYVCRNMTMEAFAAALQNMTTAPLGNKPVRDDTGLKGKYTFDLQFTIWATQDTADWTTIFTALDKELGLKLEPRQVPTPVLVVENANRKPSANPPGTAEALPTPKAPTEFEVASLKPTDPDIRAMRFQLQPGGRLVAQSQSLRLLINRAFEAMNNDQLLQGLPDWATSERFDIMATAPAEGAPTGPIDSEWLAPMLRALLVDRFKIAYHTEERPVTAYALTAVKPKLKKADPESRIYCKSANLPPGSAPTSLSLACQNISMAQLAERLYEMSALVPELSWPVSNATELDGGWDFTLTYDQMASRRMTMPAGGRGGDSAQPEAAASDPSGGPTLFEAVEKQLGLKLEKQKRNEKVIVFDHIERTPTGN